MSNKIPNDLPVILVALTAMALWIFTMMYIGNQVHQRPKNPNVHCRHVMMAVVCE